MLLGVVAGTITPGQCTVDCDKEPPDQQAVAKKRKKQEQWAAIVSAGDFTELMSAGGCKIALTEKRAMSLMQLDMVERHICTNLKEGPPWMVSRPEADGNWTEVTLRNPQQVNLYDLNSQVILPATFQKELSMVEFISTQEQPPDFFVSHWFVQ